MVKQFLEGIGSSRIPRGESQPQPPSKLNGEFCRDGKWNGKQGWRQKKSSTTWTSSKERQPLDIRPKF